MRNISGTPARTMAFGGVTAALAVIIMCMGGMIPVFTYTAPMLCAVVLQMVLRLCGVRIAWAWFAAVAILSMLMSPDKEAAAVLLFLGYYPILKPVFERRHLAFLWKHAFFNGSVLVMYWLLMNLMGMNELREEYAQTGRWMLVLLLLLGNVTFFLLDRVLELRIVRKRK